MALAPLTSIPSTVSLTATGTENQDRLASLNASPNAPSGNARSTGGTPQRLAARRSTAEDTPQPSAPNRPQRRDARADTSALRADTRNLSASRSAQGFKPRDEVSLSFALNSGSGETTTRVAQTGTSGTRVAPTNTPSNRTPDTGAPATAVTAKQVLAAYDALLQQTLGAKFKLPADLTHADRIKYTAETMKLVSPPQRAAFAKQAEAIGQSLGLNFGLTKTDAAGKKVSINDGLAAKLNGDAAQEYRKIAAELPKAAPATTASPAEATGTEAKPTATQTPQAIAQAWAKQVDSNADGSISAQEITAAQKNTPELAAAWATISPDGAAVSTEKFATGLATLIGGQTTPTTTPATAGVATAAPDAAAFKKLDLQAALVAVGKMDGKAVAAMVASWAEGGQTVSKAQLQAANPAMAAVYFRDGKDAVSVATLTQDLTQLTGEQPTTPTPAATVTPAAGTQK